MTLRHLTLACSFLVCSFSAQAAINNNAATHGQWQSAGSSPLSVGADGVRSYAQNEEECRNLGAYHQKAYTISGSDLKESLQATAEYHRDVLPSVSGREAAQYIRTNLTNIQKILPLVQSHQNYQGIDHACGEGSEQLIFLNSQTAVQAVYEGGETFYQLYRK